MTVKPALLLLLLLLACRSAPSVSPTGRHVSSRAPLPVAQSPSLRPASVGDSVETATWPELEVTTPPRAVIVAEGDPAPVFRATAHNGWRVESTGGPRPRVLVVYFYPRDETPGCTREACAFRDFFRQYAEAGADVVGVSTDTKAAHDAFAARYQLPFGLIADPQGRLVRAFGLDPGGGVAPRATFVIGRDGRIARVFPNVRVDGHADEVLAAVRAQR